jgi:hypothetical protein
MAVLPEKLVLQPPGRVPVTPALYRRVEHRAMLVRRKRLVKDVLTSRSASYAPLLPGPRL